MRLIDADYILSALNVFSDREHGNEHFLLGIKTAREIVKDAPTIEPKSQWIPVAERLPETSQDVLITKRKEFGTVRVMKAFYMSSDDGGIWASQCGTDTTGVIAWLPMPEPYKPEGLEGSE